MRNFVIYSILFCALMVSCMTSKAVYSEPIKIDGRLELMVDDYLIDSMHGGANLQLHHPIRNEVVMVTDKPWEGNACAYRSVFKDGDLYRMYYTGNHYTTGGKESEALPKHPLFMCYAESKDGINWTRPDVGLVEFNGSKSNNILLAPSVISGVKVDPGHAAVFMDENPDCPPDAKYKAIIVGDPKGMYAFKSADGIHFSLMSTKPLVTKGAFDSENLVFWDPIRREYREYHRDFMDGVRGILTSTSKDLAHFSDPVWLEYPGAPTQALYTNQIRPYYRAPHIFVGFPMRYTDRGWSEPMRALPQLEERIARASHESRFGTAVTDGLFMTSRDGSTFNRWSEAFIRPSSRVKDTWVYGDNLTAWGLVETKSTLDDAPNELSIYVTEGYWRGTSINIRRYSLRTDGFVSVNAPFNGGEFITKPLVFDGGNLAINFETSAAGSIRVEIQDANGQPIEGYKLEDCPELFGNSIKYTVRWNRGGDVRPLAGKPVRLRFVLKDADLYALQFIPYQADPVRPNVSSQ